MIVDSLPQATGGDDEDDGADANASYSAVFCALGEDQVRVSAKIRYFKFYLLFHSQNESNLGVDIERYIDHLVLKKLVRLLISCTYIIAL